MFVELPTMKLGRNLRYCCINSTCSRVQAIFAYSAAKLPEDLPGADHREDVTGGLPDASFAAYIAGLATGGQVVDDA